MESFGSDDDSSTLSGSVSNKKSSKYKRASSVKSRKKIAAIEEGEEEDLDDELNIWEKTKGDPRTEKSKRDDKVGPGDDLEEPELKFKNTTVEEGTKQRKVNKRLKSYESKGDSADEKDNDADARKQKQV